MVSPVAQGSEYETKKKKKKFLSAKEEAFLHSIHLPACNVEMKVSSVSSFPALGKEFFELLEKDEKGYSHVSKEQVEFAWKKRATSDQTRRADWFFSKEHALLASCLVSQSFRYFKEGDFWLPFPSSQHSTDAQQFFSIFLLERQDERNKVHNRFIFPFCCWGRLRSLRLWVREKETPTHTWWTSNVFVKKRGWGQKGGRRGKDERSDTHEFRSSRHTQFPSTSITASVVNSGWTEMVRECCARVLLSSCVLKEKERKKRKTKNLSVLLFGERKRVKRPADPNVLVFRVEREERKEEGTKVAEPWTRQRWKQQPSTLSAATQILGPERRKEHQQEERRERERSRCKYRHNQGQAGREGNK